MSVSEEDHLLEDDPITGQAYVCMSFVSPREVVSDKNAFRFERYVKEVFSSKVDAFLQAVKSTPERVEEFAKSLKSDASEVHVDYEAYLCNNQSRLDDEFASDHPLQLTTSGFKVRGSYPTLEAARKRAEALQRKDKTVDVFVAQVGAWCPFNPRAETVGDVVYDETELNTMMKMKREAEAHKDIAYEEDKERRMAMAAKQLSATQVHQSMEPVIEEVGEDASDATSSADET